MERPVAPETCDGVTAAEVSEAGSRRLAAATNLLEYESMWKAERPAAAAGSLSASEIRGRIRQGLTQIQTCYQSALSDTRLTGGRVVVRFVIVAEGLVASAHVSEGFGVPALDCCVVQQVAQWRFPEPSGGNFVTVEYPFVVRLSREP